MNPPIVAPAVSPIQLAYEIVESSLIRQYSVDKTLGAGLIAGLIAVVSKTRFHLIRTQEQLDQVWADVRASDELVDLVLQGTSRLMFTVNSAVPDTGTTGVNTGGGWDRVIRLLAESFGRFGEEDSAIDPDLRERFADRQFLENVLDVNPWLAYLMLLSLGEKLLQLKLT